MAILFCFSSHSFDCIKNITIFAPYILNTQKTKAMISHDIDEKKVQGLEYLFERFGRDFSLTGFFLKGVLLDDNGELRLTYSQKSDFEDRTFQVVFFFMKVVDFYNVHVNTQKTVIEGIDITLDTSGHFFFSDRTNKITILCGDFRINFHDILSEKFAKDKREELINIYCERLIKKVDTLNNLKFKDGKSVFNRDDTYNGIKADRHIMYKLPSLHNEDGSIYYEFLIEVDKNDPCLGIYYGCKGLIKKGDNKEKIKEMDEDWEEIKPKVLERLKNLYPSKDFKNRFKLTDNANDNTYWPFWISLYEDENVQEVAARVTIIIRDEYDRFLGKDIYKADETSKHKIKDVNILEGEVKSVTRYTEESWESLLRPWVRKETGTENDGEKRKKKGKTETDIQLEIAEEIWEDLLKQFVEGSKREGLLVEDNDKFEKAYKWQTESNQLAFMLRLLVNERLLNKFKERYIERLKPHLKMENLKGLKLPKGAKVPWGKISWLFLNQKGKVINDETLKNLEIDNNYVIKNTKALFDRIMKKEE